MVSRLLVLSSACRPMPSCPQSLPNVSLSPMLVSDQSLEGAETAGCWHVGAALNVHTPGWVATVLGFGLKLATRSERASTLGRSWAAGQALPALQGQGPSWAPESAEMLGSTAVAGWLQGCLGGLGSCLLLAPKSTGVHRSHPGLGGCSCAWELTPCQLERGGAHSCPWVPPAPWSTAPPQTQLHLGPLSAFPSLPECSASPPESDSAWSHHGSPRCRLWWLFAYSPHPPSSGRRARVPSSGGSGPGSGSRLTVRGWGQHSRLPPGCRAQRSYHYRCCSCSPPAAPPAAPPAVPPAVTSCTSPLQLACW